MHPIASPRCRTAISLAVGLFFAAGLALSNLGATSLAAPAAQRVVNPRQSPCLVEVRQRAWPDMILLGETTTLEISVKPVCPNPGQPMHIVLVLDASGSMVGEPTGQMKSAARRFIDLLDLPSNPNTRLAVVQFNESARTLCQLNIDVGRISGCISKIEADGGTAIDRGITEGIKVMRQGRNQASGSVINEIMVVLTDGRNADGCPPVTRAAQQAKGQGILLISICLGPGCDEVCMQAVASSSEFYIAAKLAPELVPIFEGIVALILDIGLRQSTLIVQLPEDLPVVENSAQPPAEVSLDGNRLEWQRTFLSQNGTTVRFDVRPKQPGFRRLTTSVDLEFRDLVNRYGNIAAAPAWISVFGPILRPTPAP